MDGRNGLGFPNQDAFLVKDWTNDEEEEEDPNFYPKNPAMLLGRQFV